ncbi:receptor-like protein 35 isoform X3 [Ziziphus jujuba]|uniref:Receptor-like protein 35 isoform X3 n=1 Tax=Ziziphus jujuba TaxID=326968 RepID=A0ABM3ZXQ5_ZIZJJ|nr:receptor-like protein 35 isoform X3 [Ziziphus jujuba]
MTIPVLVSWLFLMLSIYSSLFGHVVVVVGQCLSHQQSLLLQLKHAIIFNETSSKILVNWNESSDCCTWPGITCDDDGRVIGLKLSNEQISGGIHDNSTLFNLVDLKSLDLSSNEDLQSEMPSRIGNLTNLNYLNLSNSFWFHQIPKTISLLNKLLILDLSYSDEYYCLDQQYDKGSNLSMHMFTNLTRLEELYVGCVNLSASGNEWGQALSSSLPNLRVLSLISCSLSGPIDKSLAKLQYLSVIHLDDNDLLSSKVPKFFANFSNLTTLSLSGCGLYGMFPKEIFQVPTLTILDISRNELLGGSLPEFPLDSDLQSLVLYGTNFSGSLPASIGNLGQLSRLDIYHCQFSGSLPKSMANLTQLVHLDLSSNMFTVPIPSFNMSKILMEINLSNNSLNGNIPSSLFALPSLDSIHLANNQFSGVDEFPNVSSSVLKSIDLRSNKLQGTVPSSLFALPSLESIHLGKNQFSRVDEFPNVSSSVLNSIDLSSNNLRGTVPSSLFTLPSLEEIDLANNQFTGVDEFSNVSSSVLKSIDLRSNKLQVLNSIDLSSNNLRGTVPSSLFTLPSLKEIDLANNQFTGVDEFPNVSSSVLNSIDLSSNKLQGTVPSSLFTLPSLEKIDLANNQFTGVDEFQNVSSSVLEYLGLASCKLGVFPYPIKNLALFDLDLSNNQISGEIPNWIWKVAVQLNLSHNQLVGMQEPYSLQNLSSLDLSFNQLHGKIPILPPNAFYIDLSSNNFQSSIPSDIGNNLNAVYVSLSNSGLTGVIPESICKASNLEALDLSNNTLSGKIPTCIFAMDSIVMVKLRRNNLSGPIPDAFPDNCKLEILDLYGNLLTDRIPKSLVNCHPLKVLNLGKNQMLDTFPLFLKRISTLLILILKSNRLHGSITCADNIGGWPVIEIVVVASNNFSGELPFQCLTTWGVMKGDSPFPLPSASHFSYNRAMSSFDYKDVVPVTNKRLEMDLVKVPEGFTCIDFSSNNFSGEIPKQLGLLTYLKVLNLSNNALSGHIPSSFGNMHELESLDLSRNRLNGEIPASLSNLNFLEVLDLSHNQLSGRIPKGTQIQTFSADCFQDNEGLCGPPLTPRCKNDEVDLPPKTSHEASHQNSGNEDIKWDLISAEVGFVVGFGTVIGPLVFSSRWRKRYYDRVEDIAFRILPNLILEKWLSWKMGMRK